LFGVQLGAFDGVVNQKKGVNTIPYIKKGNQGFKFLHQMTPLSNKKLTSFLEIFQMF